MANRLYFNVTGPCIPLAHYMVDISKKIDHIITEYVDAGAYFIITVPGNMERPLPLSSSTKGCWGQA